MPFAHLDNDVLHGLHVKIHRGVGVSAVRGHIVDVIGC
jgi:hypothetical protein